MRGLCGSEDFWCFLLLYPLLIIRNNKEVKAYIFLPSDKGRRVFPALAKKGYLWDGLEHLIRFLNVSSDGYDFAVQSDQDTRGELNANIMVRGKGVPKEEGGMDFYCHIGSVQELSSVYLRKCQVE